MRKNFTLGISLAAFMLAAGHAGAQCNASKDKQAKCNNEADAAAKVVAVGMIHDRMADNIVETAVKAGKFKTLAAALTAADLVDALKGDGPFTVFAPTDEAFAKLPPDTLANLLKPENKPLLVSILKYHVVKGAVKAEQVVGMTNASTLNGQRVDIGVKESVVSLDKSKVTKTDIECSNGVIHVIDAVLMPSTKNIVETAVDAGSFKTLASLLQSAGLVDALKGDGPFTVFAPTDEAFAKLPKSTIEMLGKPESKDALAAILKYHVVSGRVFSDDAMKLHEAKTLNGQSFKISKEGKYLMIDAAKVTRADLDATNGVIHVIDTVIMPK